TKMADTKSIKSIKKAATVIIAVAVVISAIILILTDSPLLKGLENTLGRFGKVSQDAPFAVYFADVGQGDCTLLICNDKTMLIDAGENGHESDVFNLLYSQGIKQLDYIVVSHPHSDHIGGISEVIDEFGCEKLYTQKLPEGTEIDAKYTWSLIEKSAERSETEISFLSFGDSFDFGGAKVDVLGPVTIDAENLNNSSLILKITYGSTSFLFTADAESDEEMAMLEQNIDLKSDVLRVAHHGSKYSSSTEFLEAVSPRYAIISVGKNNDYGHPHEQAIQRLEEYTSEIYRTDRCGTIKALSDGKNISISYDS
ncbi:MAG: MBL fold metallo-hydrolase, partial [Clostridia bacterium]|nr:MBL fold metallo-hydrolase [Clostridia bacterium]